ncbi:MAG: heme-binding protein [Candidatus Dadabacteria bacterium]|nr:heme-binding protein [Candidatus Dadabacteria bacterium]NIQ16614.1 heme-binding protein [Candidatus Dadabacteria bacterium]
MYSIVTLLIILFVINSIPVKMTNPPVTSDINTPQNVKKILRESCYDCHSNETTWYWYTEYAPVSWLITHDVNEGREYLNFSTWDKYSNSEKKELLSESIETIKEGEMPMKIYEIMHPDSKITKEELSILTSWIISEYGKISFENNGDD